MTAKRTNRPDVNRIARGQIYVAIYPSTRDRHRDAADQRRYMIVINPLAGKHSRILVATCTKSGKSMPGARQRFLTRERIEESYCLYRDIPMSKGLMHDMNAYTPHDYDNMTEREKAIARRGFEAGRQYEASLSTKSVDAGQVLKAFGVLKNYNWDVKEADNIESRDWYCTTAVYPALKAALE